MVKDGILYAAAGIAHYDGTHVVAVDAITGELKWHNDSSGTLSTKAESGISLQGSLRIRGRELQFLGGGTYETARYDLRTGECLNKPDDTVRSKFHTAFYAYYPDYAKYQSLAFLRSDGKALSYDASYEGSRFSRLGMLGPLPAGVTDARKPASRWGRNRKSKRKVLWAHKGDRKFTAFVVTPKALLAAGHAADNPKAAFLAAFDLADGSELWVKQLPSTVIKSGAAVDHQGRIVVSTESGDVFCFAGGE